MDAEAQLVDLAGAILDGAPIDWTLVESSADVGLRPLIDRMRVIATLAGIHRDGGRASGRHAPAALEVPADWGPLRVLERIGAGAFGEVYRAWDPRLDRHVALKLLPADADADTRARAIVEEGRLLARVRHPHVVTVYGAERIDRRVGLWMELVEGRTLEQLLGDGRVFTPAEVAAIGIQVSSAAAAVHAAGVLHRDIKAQNVMLADDGRAVLMDFGTGRELSDAAAADLAGTPLYLAPEVLDGGAPTVRSDIYSLGVLLFRLLTRSFPVSGRSLGDLRLAHVRSERSDVRHVRPDVPAKLSRIIDRAIARAPGQRHESAAALNADLKALESRPRPAMAAIAAAALVAVAGVVWEVAARGTGATRPSAMIAGFLPASPAAVAEPRIVVLPLVNLSAEPGGEHFADGLTDELIRNLAVVEGLDVRSRTSSFAFKGRNRNLREVADRLDVNLALEATVLRAGDRIRLNASLIDIAADVPLWTGQFERELTVKNIFDIQDEIARGIVDELRLKLGAGPRRYDLNVAAYELYLSARQLVDLRGAGNARKAAELFGQVIRKDPAFAPAHAGLALAYAYLSQPANGIQFEEAHPVMRYAAIEALRLDPQLADAHCARGWVFARERDWGRAEESFRRAIALNPSLTQSYTGFTLSTLVPLGRDEEALRLLRSALRTDPLSVSLLNQLGEVQLFADRYDEAVATLQEAWAIDPDLPFARLYLARALMFAGRVAEGIAFLEEATRSSYYLAYGYVAAGRRPDAERLLAVRPENLYSHAIIHAALGNDDEVVAAYERLATIEPHRVVLTLRFPELKRVRDDPRMVALRQRLGLP